MEEGKRGGEGEGKMRVREGGREKKEKKNRQKLILGL